MSELSCRQCLNRGRCWRNGLSQEAAGQGLPGVADAALLHFTLASYGVLLLALAGLVYVIHMLAPPPALALVLIVTGLRATSLLASVVLHRRGELTEQAKTLLAVVNDPLNNDQLNNDQQNLETTLKK